MTTRHSEATESLSRYAKQIATTGASARTFVDSRDADVCFGGVGRGPNVPYFVAAITAGGDSFPAGFGWTRRDRSRPPRFRTRLRCAAPCTTFPSRRAPTATRCACSGMTFITTSPATRSPSGDRARPPGGPSWSTPETCWSTNLESVPILPSSVPRTAENMYLYNAFRDQGDSLGFTDDREFRIRALNAAGNSGWSNVVRPFQ